jgi:ComF family protein
MSRALNVIWPPRSLVSGHEITGPGLLEADAWAKLTFLSAPLCVRCGLPFEIAVEDDQVCGGCLAHPPAFDRARAAVIYGDVSRNLILALKYQGRRDGLETLGRWMATAGAGLLAQADLIVPVPLHYFRLIRRGYNQSVWLAAAVGRGSRVPVDLSVLKRSRHTPTQGAMTASGRRRNVQGAFRVADRAKARVSGRRILLVDDVFTTGATVEACARTLKRAGAAHVDVLTLARVEGPRPAPI